MVVGVWVSQQGHGLIEQREEDKIYGQSRGKRLRSVSSSLQSCYLLAVDGLKSPVSSVSAPIWETRAWGQSRGDGWDILNNTGSANHPI